MNDKDHKHLSPFNLHEQKGDFTDPAMAQEKIKELIDSSDIFIFMKGNPDRPQCGFSANTVGIFKKLGKSFKTFDILTDPVIRQSVKEYSNWPTLPQVYIQKKFVGGNDVVTELYESGELEEMVKNL